MTAFERIEAQYAAHPQEEPFANYVMHYHRYGFVFSRPEFVVIGRPVSSKAPHSQIKDSRISFPTEDCDAWFIFAASGNMARMWSVLPYFLPFMCWTRVQDPLAELTITRTETVMRLCPHDGPQNLSEIR